MKNNKILIIVILNLFFSNFNYAQCIKGNCDNGQGEWKYLDGSIVKAEFKNQAYTYAIKTFPDGTVYQGEFMKAQFDGKGYLKKKNGDFMIGFFKKDTLYSGYEYKNNMIIQKMPKISNAELTKIGQGVSQLKKEEQQTQVTTETKPQEIVPSTKPISTTVESHRIMNANPKDALYTHFMYTGKLVNDVPEDDKVTGVYYSEINELYTYTGQYRIVKREGTGEIQNSKYTLQKAKKNKQKIAEKYSAEFKNDIEQIKQ